MYAAMNKTQLNFTRRALADYDDIMRYTLQRWGKKQWSSYKIILDKAFGKIAENPGIGKARYGLKMYTAGKHCIFYRVRDKVIYILRILHQRMDFPQHLTFHA